MSFFHYKELYYGGEGVSVEQPQSLTCPYCGKMGFTETALQEHVSADHSDATTQVVSFQREIKNWLIKIEEESQL